MSPSSVDLGRFDLVSTTSGLQLQLSSLAQFATSVEDDHDPESLTAQILIAARRQRPWIHRASGFRLVLGLRMAGDIEEAVSGETVERLTASIQKAQLWRQLRLTPTAVEVSSNDASGLNIITISLSYDDEPQGPVRRRLHKIGADVPFYDLKPPSGVPAHALDVVHLALSISRTSRRKRGKLDTGAEQNVAATDYRTLDSGASAALDWCDEELLGTEANVLANESDLDDLLLASLDDDGSQDAPSTSPGNSDGAEDREVDLPAMLRKRSSSVSVPQADGEPGVGPEHMLQLIDAAVRLAISDTPKRLGKGMRVSYNETFKHLSDMAPSLWSPGYLPAMSDRALFLPTISHALNSIGRKTGNARLRSKMAKLSGRAAYADDHGSQERIGVRLWRLLQVGLYDGDAARRLKPLAISGTAYHSLGEENRLNTLDESQQSSQEADIALDDGLDDFNSEYDELDSAELCDEELLDSLLYGGGNGDIMADTEDHGNELGRLEQLLNEPSHGPSLRDHPKDTSISGCIASGLGLRDEDDSDEDLLSICGSVGSLSMAAESIGPDTEQWYANESAGLGAEVVRAEMNGGCPLLIMSKTHHYDDAHEMLAI
ncbi:hypothetical protein LTR85_006809 [Meristemomyces frigidus]|nr:hypothetical protein LTR85_006809 [Meristemomyces frigidus]